MGLKVTWKDVAEMVKSIDTDNSNTIDFDEFKLMMKAQDDA